MIKQKSISVGGKRGVVMRITEKKENGFYELKEGQEIYGEENGIRLVQIVGQYEDIKEELGIDLITLFKALKNGAYIPFYGQIISLEKYKIDFPNKRFIAKHFNGKMYEETLYFKDYGETWALKKEGLL